MVGYGRAAVNVEEYTYVYVDRSVLSNNDRGAAIATDITS